jgi:HSP20 family protein
MFREFERLMSPKGVPFPSSPLFRDPSAVASSAGPSRGIGTAGAGKQQIEVGGNGNSHVSQQQHQQHPQQQQQQQGLQSQQSQQSRDHSQLQQQQQQPYGGSTPSPWEDLAQWPSMLFRTQFQEWKPFCDIKETDDAFVIDVEIPGAKKEDIKVTLDNDRVLTIRGEVRQEFEESDSNSNLAATGQKHRPRFHRVERNYGSFERQMTLPDDSVVDTESIKCKYEDGLLKVTVPKKPGADLSSAEQKKVKDLNIE